MWISVLTLLPSLKNVGDYFFRDHQYKEAIKTYKMVIREIPSPEIKLRIGVSFYRIGDYLSAEKWLLESHKSQVASHKLEAESLLSQMYFKKGANEFKKGNLDSALFWFKKANDRYNIALVLYKIGNKEEARKIFQELANEGSYKSINALGIIDYREGQLEESIAWFKKLEPEKEASGNIGAALYRMSAYQDALEYFEKEDNNFFAAECYYRLEKFEDAEKCYKKYLNNESQGRIALQDTFTEGRCDDIIAPTRITNKEDALYGLAWTHYKLGKFSEAGEEFASCRLSHFSGTGQDEQAICVYYAGMSFFKIGKLSESIMYFEKLPMEYPECEFIPDSYYWSGKANFAKANYQTAIRKFETLREDYPNHELSKYACLMIGNVYYKTGKNDSAIVWFNKINTPEETLRSNWLLDEARFKTEECYFKLGEYGSRIDILRNFVRKYPKSKRVPKFELELAKYWESQNNFREAIRAYNHIIQEFSRSSLTQKAKLRLAECYFKIGSHEEAIKIYKELTHTDLRVQAQVQLAETYFSLTQYNKAIHEYEILVNDFSESDKARDAQEKIGLCYEYLGLPKEARIEWETFINKYPTDPKLWDIWLKLARTYWDEGFTEEYEKALLFIETRGKGSAKHETTFLLGSLYQDRSDYERAQSFYLKAVEQYADADSKSRALIGAAQCANSLGNLDKAQEFCHKVLLLRPNARLEELARKEEQKTKNGEQN